MLIAWAVAAMAEEPPVVVPENPWWVVDSRAETVGNIALGASAVGPLVSGVGLLMVYGQAQSPPENRSSTAWWVVAAGTGISLAGPVAMCGASLRARTALTALGARELSVSGGRACWGLWGLTVALGGGAWLSAQADAPPWLIGTLAGASGSAWVGSILSGFTQLGRNADARERLLPQLGWAPVPGGQRITATWTW